MIVDPGSLDKKIVIAKIEYGERDSSGFRAETHKPVRKCYAKVSNSTGTELIKANAEFSEVKVRFLVRYSKKEINEDMVVKYAGDVFDIKYTNDYDYGHEFQEIWGVKRCQNLN